ncbi:hypothetical protein P280DRAFT_468500 [Massarina eburnea CBS 473.64]|uniref:Uncharacterized protein n=1 Tax=Massarina eburnea CBS 473.64 TaxID=1395130 RepID=A0A6A6S4J3_9PLEO|nr:hypothetical protein P280DRAFT_468500 [Massarina eburnea CBS 473.64]
MSLVFDQSRFEAENSPCNESSHFHDLGCTHRIKAPYVEYCGENCKTPGPGRRFICAECITDQVRMEMMFSGLRTDDTADVYMADEQMTREEKIHLMAQRHINKCLQEGDRLTVVVRKLETPLLQFFDDFPEAGNLFAEPVEEEKASKPKRKRPGKNSGVEKPAVSKLVRSLPLLTAGVTRGGRMVNAKGQRLVVTGPMRSTPAIDIDMDVGEDNDIEDAFRIGDPNVPSKKGPGGNTILKNALGTTPSLRRAVVQEEKRRQAEKGADELADMMADHQVSIPEEDEVTKAVREVMEALSLKTADSKSGSGA